MSGCSTEGWRAEEWLRGNMLPLHPWGPESEYRAPTSKVGMVVHTCNPTARKWAKTGGPTWLVGQLVYPKWQVPGSVKDLFSNIIWKVVKEEKWGWPLTSSPANTLTNRLTQTSGLHFLLNTQLSNLCAIIHAVFTQAAVRHSTVVPTWVLRLQRRVEKKKKRKVPLS